MFDLKGKVALITGGASGIGLAECRLFVDLGAQVALADVRVEKGRKRAAELGVDRCLFVEIDVSKPEGWTTAVDRVVARFGGLDCLLNNAGILRTTPIETTDLADYMAIVNVNQVGTFLGMQAVVPAMRRRGGGSIVNVSSTSGVQGSPGSIIAYTASKFAVRGMTRAAAIELGPLGIRVNTVVPGVLDTPMNSANPSVLSAVEALARLQPIPRLGQPEECARVAAFLCSDAASYCTGADYVVDGEFLAGSLPIEPGSK